MGEEKMGLWTIKVPVLDSSARLTARRFKEQQKRTMMRKRPNTDTSNTSSINSTTNGSKKKKQKQEQQQSIQEQQQQESIQEQQEQEQEPELEGWFEAIRKATDDSIDDRSVKEYKQRIAPLLWELATQCAGLIRSAEQLRVERLQMNQKMARLEMEQREAQSEAAVWKQRFEQARHEHTLQVEEIKARLEKLAFVARGEQA